MLQLKGTDDDHSYLVMSQSAFDSLRPAQVQLLEAHATLISSSSRHDRSMWRWECALYDGRSVFAKNSFKLGLKKMYLCS